jgi:hypothetical protein
MGAPSLEFFVEGLTATGWQVIAGVSSLHIAKLIRDSLTPQPESEMFKGIRLRVVNEKGEEQE